MKSSAELHPDLFTGYKLSFRTNVLRAIRKHNVSYKDMTSALNVDGMTFARWVNEKEEPTGEKVKLLAEYLKGIGYEWE